MLTQMIIETEEFSDNLKVFKIVTDIKWNQNCFLLFHLLTSEIILIDPGGGADFIIKAVSGLGGFLKRILITHPHHDHIGAAAQISDHFNIPCELHKKDERLLKHAPMYALTFAGKQLTPPTAYVCFDGQLEAGESDYLITSIHTPGHTKGGTCYVFDDIVFTGDTLLYRELGRTDLPGGDRDIILKSVKDLLDQVPNGALILPGHGRAWTVAEAKLWLSEIGCGDLE